MSEPIFVAFASQKGGSGKSTLTTLVASYLHYVENIDVLVMDCDPRQHSQRDYRDNDVLVTTENPYLKKVLLDFYKKSGRSVYDIKYCDDLSIAIDKAEEAINEGDPAKVVFFDITGTINDSAIVNLIASMHYLFVPITTDTGDMKSSLRFADYVMQRMVTTNKTSIKDLRLLWNKIPGRSKIKVCELIDDYMEELGLHSLSSVLSNSTKYFKDGASSGKIGLFRSTMLPPDKRLLKGSNLPELVSEIRKIIKV